MADEEVFYREHFLEVLEALHRDQTGLAQSLVDIRRMMKGWSWVVDSRGSYEWDDPDYQKEFGYCIERVVKEIDEALKRTSDAHKLCCGRYRHINRSEDIQPVQETFPYGRTYEQHKESIVKATTVGP